MHRDKFLQQVADYYTSRDVDLSNYTFVFPNKRSALFARRYIRQTTDAVRFMPRMVSVTQFTQNFNNTALATPNELVFILYNVYCEILRKHGRESQIPEFDAFYFWGSIIIKDFNDVDAYMVDPTMIFRNLKSVKEISANYLTEEQIEIIELLWGQHTAYRNPEIFWNHISDHGKDNSPSDQFINLWEIMGELYDNFVKRLDSLPTPLSYSGLQSRRACNIIKEMSKEDFSSQRYVFVGFNVLSTSRTLIFRHLQRLGIADFFWDTTSPYLRDSAGSPTKAGRFIIPLSEKFPSPEDFELIPPSGVPDIKIASIASSVGQTKAASAILESWVKDGIDNPNDMIDTTLVIPDDNLLVPMLFGVPEDISKVNVTMGVSFVTTPFAVLMSSIISMHLRAYSVRGQMHYFYQDVLNVISHQYIQRIWPESSNNLNKYILDNHLYNVKAEDIINEFKDLAFIFRVVKDPRDIDQAKAYITGVLKTLADTLAAHTHAEGKTDCYENAVLQGYSDAVDEICRLMQTYRVGLREHTFFQIIERTMSMLKMHVVGMPVEGLQIMGMMDTRALDFKNVIILSVNERILPKRNYTPSLIPATLRRGYMLPTSDHEEASYAYQFYRLIARAQRVTLIYDSRSGGLNSGEMSRYAAQLLHLNNVDQKLKYPVSCAKYEMQSHTSVPREITIEKTDKIKAELREFFPGGRLRLSASALKSYITCPLQFYLKFVKGLRVEDPVIEYIDPASYGTVLHSMLQHLYEPYVGKRINEEVIGIMMNSDLEGLAARMLDSIYYKSRYQNNLSDMPGEGLVTARILAKYVRNMLKIEKSYQPFIFQGAEVGEGQVYQWKINDKYTVNFKMSVDRIDIIHPSDNPAETVLRFIDYKTGNDKSVSTNLKDLFEAHENGGMFQLLLYCHAYANLFDFPGKIKPVIYGFVKMAVDGIPDLQLGQERKRYIIDDYHVDENIRDDEGRNFYQRFESLIDMIFDDEHPFTQTEKVDNCRYCKFKQICGRDILPDKY